MNFEKPQRETPGLTHRTAIESTRNGHLVSILNEKFKSIRGECYRRRLCLRLAGRRVSRAGRVRVLREPASLLHLLLHEQLGTVGWASWLGGPTAGQLWLAQTSCGGDGAESACN